MIPQLGTIRSGINLKAVILTAAFCIYSAGGVSGLNMAPSPIKTSGSIIARPAVTDSIDIFRDRALWDYLRSGINYVEASGKEVPKDFIHPGGVAYGPLALTRIAIKDVILHYRSMSDYTVDDVLVNDILYEECGKLYADLLLRHYLKMKNNGISREDIFNILQKAWFLGPTIFKSGGNIPDSRARNVREYIKIAKTD